MINPFETPRTVKSTSSRRMIPFREILFGLTLCFHTLVMSNFNSDISVALHTTAVISFVMIAGILAIWGSVLAVLLDPARNYFTGRVVAGFLTAVAIALATGLLMIRSNRPPHGMLLPLSVLTGACVAYWRPSS